MFTRLCIIWLTRPSETPQPAGKVLTVDHRVVRDEVQRPLLRGVDAEGRRSLCHALGSGNEARLRSRRLGEAHSPCAALGTYGFQVVVGSPQSRRVSPESAPSFQSVLDSTAMKKSLRFS